MGWGREGRITLTGRRGGRGEERFAYRYAVVMYFEDYGASFLSFHGIMVYYSWEAMTLRTLRSLLDRTERIHKDG